MIQQQRRLNVSETGIRDLFRCSWPLGWTFYGLLFLMAWLTGCVKPVMDTPNPIEIDAREYRRMYHASVLALRELGFRVGRQDYRFGKVSSYPMAAETVLEPWYTSNTSLGQAVESTLNQQRRIASVSWQPVAEPHPTAGPWEAIRGQEGQSYWMRVEVLVERLQAPGRHLSGSTHGHALIASLSAVPTEWADRGIADRLYWQPLGRDPLLEQRFIATIVRKSLTLKLPPVTDFSD